MSDRERGRKRSAAQDSEDFRANVKAIPVGSLTLALWYAVNNMYRAIAQGRFEEFLNWQRDSHKKLGPWTYVHMDDSSRMNETSRTLARITLAIFSQEE